MSIYGGMNYVCGAPFTSEATIYMLDLKIENTPLK